MTPIAPGAARPIAAVTGATGFIGRHLVTALAAAGWRPRLLLRRDVDRWGTLDPEIVPGALESTASLQRLVDGADVVIHLAGLIKAARREAFFRVNQDGARRLANTFREHAPASARFIMVSSLAAREPTLSDYAASKRAGEQAVLDTLGTRASVLRPPAVYGPGDRETLAFFQLARAPVVPLLGPASARAALIHVQDLVRLIVTLAALPGSGRVVTAADERPAGYSWQEVLQTAALAQGNTAPRLFQAPHALLRGVAAVGDLAKIFGSTQMLGSQKLRELRHPDWSVHADELPAGIDWQPEIPLAEGFADAVRWYRQAGWL